MVNNRMCNSVTIPNTTLWHFILDHVSNSVLEEMFNQFSYLHVIKSVICDVCPYAKQKRLPYTVSTNRVSHSFELLHMDIWDPFAVTSIHGHKYFLTKVDDHSRFAWLIMLKEKYEVQVKRFIVLVEKQYNVVVKRFRSDNGPKFSMPSFYGEKGIIHERNCVETHQQNGRVQRKHQHILNVVKHYCLSPVCQDSFGPMLF